MGHVWILVFFWLLKTKGSIVLFCALEWFVGFRFFHCCSFSLDSLSLSPLHSCTSGFHSLLTRVAIWGHKESKLQADAAGCEGAAMHVFPTSLVVDAVRVPSASHSKGSRQEDHRNQGAKRASHRRSKSSPKPVGRPHASQMWHRPPQENALIDAQQEEPQGNCQSLVQRPATVQEPHCPAAGVQWPRQVRYVSPKLPFFLTQDLNLEQNEKSPVPLSA